MSPEKVTIFDTILREYPVTQIRKKTILAKTIRKTPTEQILLALILKPSDKPIENISQTINNIKELNLTDQIKTTIFSTIPELYPQFSDIHQIYLNELSIKQAANQTFN
jgi:signal transduction histidine kinase